ncbi:MAG: glycoside hydrolase family 95-like protein, partial [Planctomycetota bacterium]
QQWGSKGIYLPETTWFNGPPALPEDIAAEMRDLYLARKPWSEASEKFLKYASPKNAFDSRWCWKNFDDERWIDGHYSWDARESAPYSYVLHLFASGGNIAYFHWLRYDFTQDEEWLRQYGYPIIKGVAEFYRNYQNVKKGPDGKYHIHGVNNWESTWGASDTIEELSAMRAVTAAAIRASQILGVDEEMRGVWQEFLDNMTPLPTYTETSGEGEVRYWVNTKHSSVGRESTNRRATTPCTKYDLFTLETTDPETVELARNSYRPLSERSTDSRRVSELSKATITAATMGDAEGIKTLVPAQIRYEGLEEGHPDMDSAWARWQGPLRNRLSLMEGYQGMGAQRLGNATEGLLLALCRAMPAGPAGETVIHVFPAWPKEWDAAFTLLARGNFLVTSSIKKGEVEFVEIQSQSGGECRVRNPFAKQGNVSVSVYKDGSKWKDIDGTLVTFETSEGEKFIIVRKGSSPEQYKREVLLK